jgi:hypothetical protein
MINSNSHNLKNYNRKYSLEEQLLYDAMQALAKEDSVAKIIDDFRSIFIEGKGEVNTQLWQAISKLVDSDGIDAEFNFIINRSCYILINNWLQNPKLQGAISQFIDCFEEIPTRVPSSWTEQRLRTLYRNFINSEQYLALRRLAHVFRHKVVAKNEEISKEKPLETFIERYPFMYPHSFLTDNSSDRERQEIRIITNQAQEQYQRDVANFIKLQKQPNLSNEVKNPTLLSNQEFNLALEHFTGKVDGFNTLKDLAEKFLAFCRKLRSYRSFKEGLYEYLTVSIDPKYGKGQFSNKLYKQLQNTLPHNDSQKPSEFLFVGTCRRLLDFLVVESLEQPKHYVFYDLINNLGSVFTIGLLLKIVLFCPKVKPYLEQRFAILFQHYQSWTKNQVWWFVESMENLNLALAVNC